MEDDKLYTAKEVAEMLRITERTLYNWRKGKILTACKLGKTIRYKGSDIKATLKFLNNG